MQVRIQLRWSDFDALRHLNNVSYVEFMQDARFALLESLKLGAEHLVEVGHVVAHNEIDYLKPVGMNTRELIVDVKVVEVGGASYKLAYTFLDDSGIQYAKALTVMVQVETETGAVLRISDDLRVLLLEAR
jgi:acyl-CoA thioester hydrolase